ncbi:unannotated protein [freshwater metagenome]|uniref:Unannotated protein n=1 Tax=freshwater metagenome TaxID=449393 RepID=A0A6J7HVT7_9ZZZZ|nr:ribosomal-protein-alanine N-acetyltransferase [Actinomycetota bacterium]
MSITYRSMMALDIPVIASMERAIYPRDAWSTNQFKEELAGVPKTRFYTVAINEENQIVGYAGVFSPDREIDADINTLTVDPAFRRQGIGREMLHQMIDWAIERKSPSIFLEMREDNIEANPLYLSEGFTPISRRDDYYGSGVHAVVMKKELL